MTTRKINSLFGQINIDKDTLKAGFELEGQAGIQIEDYIMRETKLGKKMNNTFRLAEGIDNPTVYLREKQEDLTAILNRLKQSFEKYFVMYIERGFTDEEASKNALQDIASERKYLMEMHETNFPVVLN